MPDITNEMIAAAYDQGKQVIDDVSTYAEAIRFLQENYGFNPSSASDYTRNLKQMLDGKAYHRTLNLTGTRIYLDRIKNDFGSEALKNALKATELHVLYYEGLYGGNCRGLRQILFEYTDRSVADGEIIHPLEFVELSLAAAVERSEKDGAIKRRERIAKRSKKPAIIETRSVAYSRSSDVIVEVLERAAGRCECCKCTAPFVRKSNSTPYLEVHHIIPLSENGLDEVDNAKALCPNCHREAHFGVHSDKFRT